jgi:uncharacterized repeat protein (TIGR03803 family)
MAKLQGWRIGFVVFMLFAATAIAAPAQTFTTLYTFQGGLDGSGPFGPLTLYQGNLYGATCNGGRKSAGTIWKLSNGVKSIIYNFKGVKDGFCPNGSLLLDAAGNLYGTTQVGGEGGYGTVFKLSPPTKQGQFIWTHRTLFRFTGTNGNGPHSGVISDSKGNLYGTTTEGGATGDGTAYTLVLQANGSYIHKVIYQFSFPKAEFPFSGLTFDPAGNLYGTASAGKNGYGSLYKLTPSGNGNYSLSFPHAFNSACFQPLSSVLLDSAGNLYGTAERGSNNNPNGCVYQLSQGQFTILHTFGYAEGIPTGSPVLDASGNLYGETYTGGDYGQGTVFTLNPGYSILHSFEEQEQEPWGGLIIDQGGNLYGATLGDGITSFGTVFEIQP